MRAEHSATPSGTLAARLVGGDAAFWRMCALLYKNRKKLGGDIYRKLAVRIGLDEDQFVQEMEGIPFDGSCNRISLWLASLA